ncbi:MAG: hypothetical protein ACXV5H_04300 [Halobacteriota archaeon]
MGFFKLMFLPMKMMMWPMTAPCHMMKRMFKMAFHFVAVMLLVAQLVVMLFMAAMFVVFVVMWVMKKMHKMGKHGKMHMHMPSPRGFKP